MNKLAPLGDWRIQLSLQIILMMCNGYVNVLQVLSNEPKFHMLALLASPALQAIAAAIALFMNPSVAVAKYKIDKINDEPMTLASAQTKIDQINEDLTKKDN